MELIKPSLLKQGDRFFKKDYEYWPPINTAETHLFLAGDIVFHQERSLIFYMLYGIN